MKWTDQSPDNSMAHETPDLMRVQPVRTLCQSADDQPCQVMIVRPVHATVLGHLQNARIEQGGLLIGIPYRAEPNTLAEPGKSDGQPSRIVVLDSVAAPMSSGTGYSLRMEGAVWGAANKRLADYQMDGVRIVGWYHSHPGLGAFFSTTDRTTQAAFFRHPYSIGWVIDPSDDSHAMFIGANSNPVSGVIIDRAATAGEPTSVPAERH